MDEPYRAAPDVYVLPTHVPIPGVGNFLVNAFVLVAEEPVLIDTGLGIDGPEFFAALESVIAPRDLRWIWLTHDDADHTGGIRTVMEVAPRARLATHALGALRMNTWWPVPLDRVRALTFDERLSVGDRHLRAIRPPVFDNPMTMGIFDESTGALFSADSFGAILPQLTQDASDVPEQDLVAGMVAWGTFDSPWAHLVDEDRFEHVLNGVRRLDPSRILSSHLPAARGKVEGFLSVLRSLRDSEPFVPTRQRDLRADDRTDGSGSPSVLKGGLPVWRTFRSVEPVPEDPCATAPLQRSSFGGFWPHARRGMQPQRETT